MTSVATTSRLQHRNFLPKQNKTKQSCVVLCKNLRPPEQMALHPCFRFRKNVHVMSMDFLQSRHVKKRLKSNCYTWNVVGELTQASSKAVLTCLQRPFPTTPLTPRACPNTRRVSHIHNNVTFVCCMGVVFHSQFCCCRSSNSEQTCLDLFRPLLFYHADCLQPASCPKKQNALSV